MLLGIVKKNAIMMLDFALEGAEDQLRHRPARRHHPGCHVRFRPIMMTTVAALMGVAPIAVGIGAGADARRALGLAVVGGLCFSQLVTLYTTPVYYYYMEKLSLAGWDAFWGTRFKQKAPESDDIRAPPQFSLNRLEALRACATAFFTPCR